MKDEFALSALMIIAIIGAHFTYQDQLALGIMILASLYGGYCAYHHNKQKSVILAFGPGLFLILTMLASFSVAVGGSAAFMWLAWFGMLCWFGWTCDTRALDAGSIEVIRPDGSNDGTMPDYEKVTSIPISRNKFCPDCGTEVIGAFCSNCGKTQ